MLFPQLCILYQDIYLLFFSILIFKSSHLPKENAGRTSGRCQVVLFNNFNTSLTSITSSSLNTI